MDNDNRPSETQHDRLPGTRPTNTGPGAVGNAWADASLRHDNPGASVDHLASWKASPAIIRARPSLSDRSDRLHDPRLMTDALLALAEQVRLRCGAVPIDALAARAAQRQPVVAIALLLADQAGGHSLLSATHLAR